MGFGWIVLLLALKVFFCIVVMISLRHYISTARVSGTSKPFPLRIL